MIQRLMPGLLAVLCAATPASAAKTLTYCLEAGPESFNPQLLTTATGLDAARPAYDQLVEFERGTTRLVPGLAESWEVSADGLTYTFRLRRGVRFHAGDRFQPSRAVNADDVLFSFQRQGQSDHPYHKVSGGTYPIFDDLDMGGLLQAVERIDDHTVRFTLNRPQTTFLATLAMEFASILSAEYADAMLRAGTPDLVDRQPVGTGPFRFVAHHKNGTVRYEAFPDYWGGRQLLDGLVLAVTPEAAARYAKIKAGQCHVMASPNPADLPAMGRDDALRLLRQDGLNVAYLAFNTRKKPFDDARVRRAVAMAIDRRAILESVYRDTGIPARTPIPPALGVPDPATPPDFAYDPAPAYNPAGAKRLLAAAGVSPGLEVDLWAMGVHRPYLPDAWRAAGMIQADLAKIGITAKLVGREWSEYPRRLRAGEHTLALFGWIADTGDPDHFLSSVLGCAAARPGGGNVAKWCHPAFDDMIRQARQVADGGARSRLYGQALAVFGQEAPWVPIAHGTVVEAVRKEVVGYKVSPLGRHEFHGVDIGP